MSAATSTTLQAFECNVRGRDWRRVINALSPGKAKYEYYLDVRDAWADIPFTLVTVRRLGPCSTSEEFRATARGRGVPFAHVGMRVTVGDDAGIIVGNNSSANFNVLFLEGQYKGLTLNCHPLSKMRYFDDDGVEIVIE